jgi:hypothetical protein
MDESHLPRILKIIFFPPNLTNGHQTADMGMMASLKVEYKMHLLSTLLALYDQEGSYEHAKAAQKRHPEGCSGINYGRKATVLDAMYLLLKVWEDESNYVTSAECVKQCWHKANILPTLVDINNAIFLLGLCPQERQEDFIH